MMVVVMMMVVVVMMMMMMMMMILHLHACLRRCLLCLALRSSTLKSISNYFRCLVPNYKR